MWAVARKEPRVHDRILDLALAGRELAIQWADGHASRFHAIWLRDGCPCPACAHPGSGQRLLETGGLADDVALAAARLDSGGDVAVAWTDGHAATYPAAWLRSHCYCDADRPTPRRWRSWLGAGRSGLPEARHAD